MTEAEYFVVAGPVPREIKVEAGSESQCLSREAFLNWIWNRFGSVGLSGVHEGSVDAENFTLDSGEAPVDRDWVDERPIADWELYFQGREQAEAACIELNQMFSTSFHVRASQSIDWHEEWKKNYSSLATEFWRILPEWELEENQSAEGLSRTLVLRPGAGFGTGNHQTTRLCLDEIVRFEAVAKSHETPTALDFGAGSGILSIALAKCGYQVQAVEIDELACSNAVENIALNELESRIQVSRVLPPQASGFRLVVANILQSVLIENASLLVNALRSGDDPSKNSVLILSGLLREQADEVIRVYQSEFQRCGQNRPAPEMKFDGQWCSLIWT